MDKTLLFTVLFVTLSCMFMNTYAQVTTTVAPTTTATTASMTTTVAPTPTVATTSMTTTVAPTPTPTATSMTTTVAPTTTATTTSMTTTVAPTTTATTASMTTTVAPTPTVATTASMTTTVAPTPTVTTTNMTTTVAPTPTVATTNMPTTVAPTPTVATTNMPTTVAPTATNMTTTVAPTPTVATTNMTTTVAPTPTVATTNMTTTVAPTTTPTATNMTTAAVNMTTAAGNMTTATMTPAPPLTPNTTVEPLQTNVSRAECGTQQLCVAEPAVCDPSATGSCFFLAATQQSGSNFDFSISGESDGYIAATLSPDTTVGDNDTTYVCANNNGSVRFFSTVLNNGELVPTELNVNSVRGRVNGRRIQCTFSATLPSPTTRTTGISISLSDGPFNTTSGDLGSPTTRFRSPVVDLTNVNATVNNEITTATPTTTTTAATNMTTTAVNNMTTTALNNMTTTAVNNMTTTALNNMTTTAVNNMTTTALNNMTTTAVNNMTTTALNNMTTTAVNNMTTTALNNMTAVPPLTPNITVEALETNVSRAECGTQQLCVAEPAVCDPSATGSCFFLAARQQSGSNFDFSISGESDGYIAATLSPDTTVGDNDTTYVCANNNGSVRFFSTVLNNGELVPTELNVNSVRGRVNGRRIQCTFSATLPSPTTRTTGFAISLSDGPFNATSGDLGSPTTRFRSPVVDLTNVNATVNNQITTTTTATTAAPTTTANHGITFHQSLTQALLITVGALGLAML